MIGDSMATRLTDPVVLKTLYESIRPYNGALWVSQAKISALALRLQGQASQLPNARLQVEGDGIIIVRQGALPGSANWTHRYGDAANTVKSDDRLVKLPLGVLWFGGNTHMDVLPRHGHGPSNRSQAAGCSSRE